MPLPNSAAASAALNYQLTNYAQGLWNDLKDVIEVAERLAPTTNVPGTTGQFKKFDDKNSFMPEKTSRALGGEPTLIAFSATDDRYNTKPQALEVRVDK
jgi:adenylosuccinate lyase